MKAPWPWLSWAFCAETSIPLTRANAWSSGDISTLREDTGITHDGTESIGYAVEAP